MSGSSFCIIKFPKNIFQPSIYPRWQVKIYGFRDFLFSLAYILEPRPTRDIKTIIMDTEKMLKAYCLKTKEKNVPMQDAVISKTAKGGYIANGHDGKGNKMAAILSEAKALQAIQDGVATKGF
jgi:hypothetical protein